jgi:hypothetical protein
MTTFILFYFIIKKAFYAPPQESAEQLLRKLWNRDDGATQNSNFT